MWWLKLAYFNPALPFYENHFIDLLHKSVDRFLCNGKTDKVYLQINILVFISISIFHSSLSCLEKDYDLRHKSAKKKLSIILKLSMISAQCFPQRAVFYRFRNVICRNCKSVFYLSVVIFQKRKNFRGLSRRSCLTFKIVNLASCLAVASVWTCTFGLFQVKMEHENIMWNDCIMLFK